VPWTGSNPANPILKEREGKSAMILGNGHYHCDYCGGETGTFLTASGNHKGCEAEVGLKLAEELISAQEHDITRLRGALVGLRVQDELGIVRVPERQADNVNCFFCDAQSRWDKKTHTDHIEHKPDCPILLARAALEAIK
jgi:hypothetical protein